MAKSQILKQLVNNEIDLEIAISRLMIIATDIGNEELYKWAENELHGYNSIDELPPYRKLGIGNITYSGVNGRLCVTDQTLPLTAFSTDERKHIEKNHVPQSIRAMQQLAKPDSQEFIGRDLTFLAESFSRRQGISCTSITMRYSRINFVDILSAIRTKLISMFIKLDEEFGCLDNLDIDISKIGTERIDAIHTDLHTIIYSDNRSEVL